MYHIKSDKRSRTSAAEIVKGMQLCLITIPLKSITVSDIHRVTGISRATFYRLFDTPEDVLHYQYDQLMEDVSGRFAQTEYTPVMLFEDAMALGMANHEFLKAIVDNERFDLLFQYTERVLRMMDSSGTLFSKETGKMGPIQREYTITHLAMSMVATLITWEKNGRRESAAEVVQYMKEYVGMVSKLLETE